MDAPKAPVSRPLPATIIPGQAPTALAPMQDVTHWEFMKVIHQYGSPDYYFTEFLRVHETSGIERTIHKVISGNPTDRPVFVQLIGHSLEHLQRTTELLAPYPIAGIDINLGCPAPKVYKKNVGGGLLRDLEHIDRILGLLREVSPHRFTVKARIGFEDTVKFKEFISIVDRHAVDLFSLHARTVKEMYWSEVHYDYITYAAKHLSCPVMANGNITSANKGLQILKETGCNGLMVGRSAIRNPWIFRQIREALASEAVFKPTFQDVYGYIHSLRDTIGSPDIQELHRVNKLKKFLNFIGLGIDPEGQFLYQARRVKSFDELETVLETFLLSAPETPFADEPHPGLVARPNRESKVQACSFED